MRCDNRDEIASSMNRKSHRKKKQRDAICRVTHHIASKYEWVSAKILRCEYANFLSRRAVA
uniref:Uncharacterized protein n=1 Tax=Romanomermis culicivorax TaxID=13658 RepID=A0A915JET2_ROMCU